MNAFFTETTGQGEASHFPRSIPGAGGGAALIPVIIALVIVSAIGAALLSLSSMGTFSPILGNSSARAFYLAESGFRYAALKFRQGGEDMLDDINGDTFSLAPNQDFSLRFRTYKLEVTGGNGTNRLRTEVAFGSPPLLPTGNESGYVKIGGTPAEAFRDIDIPDPDGSDVEIEKSSGTWSASPGQTVRFAALSNGTPVSEGGDLQLQAGTADDFFPEHNGRFTADGKIYQYRTRDSAGDRLLGVTRVDGTWEAPVLDDGDEVVLNDFVEVHSTGSYGQGYFGATRTVTYHVPFSEAAGQAGETFYDTFGDKSHWKEENGASAEGSHEIQEIEGDTALAVTELSGFLTQTSLIEFDWETTNIDFASQWETAGNCLSYDAQIKILVDEEPAFMDGISFRLDTEGSYYGLSILQTADTAWDGIPNEIVPIYSRPAVVLWENDQSGFIPSRRWLAYHIIDPDDHFAFQVFFEDDMESGDSKWLADEGWTLIDSAAESHSPSHCWRDPEGQNPSSNITLESMDFDLTGTSSPVLTFWHNCAMSRGSRGLVEISANGGTWQELARYQNLNTGGWAEQEIDLSAYADDPSVKIRFRIQSSGNPWRQEDWYIDDVSVSEERIDWPTLLVSVKEAESVSFTSGSREVTGGDTIEGASSGATGTVYGDPVLSSGSWNSGDATGDLLLRDVEGTFSPGESLEVDGQPFATAGTVNGKQNYIRAWIGDRQAHGTANDNPLDGQRLANPRGEIHWPPHDVDDTGPSNDYFTLIQWEADLDGSVVRLGAGKEQDAVIRTSTLTTPAGGSFPPDRPELGLHTWGWGSVDGDPTWGELPDIYFDDFGVRIEGVPGASGGFAPAIQETSAGE